MKKINIHSVTNALLITWGFIWLYYMLFNWDIFIIKLNLNLGFGSVSGYPFVFSFAIGFVLLFLMRYFSIYLENQRQKKVQDLNNKLILHEKDIEIMKLKEVLFKMQSDEFSKNTTNLRELHEKLNSISEQLTQSDNPENKNEIDKE